MSESEEFLFNNDYCGRVKLFRAETNMTAEQMANLLDIPPDRYRKYENRSPMPVYLIPKFCQIVGCDLEHLILGKPRERMKPIIVARKNGADILGRVSALSNERQQVAIDRSGTGAAQLGRGRKKGTPGN
ncbi:hypothetical protein ACQZ46_02480 [Agrobacterium salinitolerans]